jgi:hypothetical protein
MPISVPGPRPTPKSAASATTSPPTKPRFEHIDEYSTAEHTAKQHAALRAGFVNFDLMRTLKLYADEDFVPAQAVLQAAADGNGAPLATVVEHNAAPWTHVAGIVIAVLPRIAAREPLATAVRTIGLPPLHHLFDFLGSLAMRRDLARAIDDDATAARCQAILDRYATMLADRDKAIAIALLDP